MASKIVTKLVQRCWKYLFAFENDSSIKIIFLYDLMFFKKSCTEYWRSITQKFGEKLSKKDA